MHHNQSAMHLWNLSILDLVITLTYTRGHNLIAGITFNRIEIRIPHTSSTHIDKLFAVFMSFHHIVYRNCCKKK